MAQRLLILLISQCFLIGIWAATCDKTAEVCEFWLEIGDYLTMIDGRNAVFSSDGKLYHWNDEGKENPIPPERVIVADGWETPRLVVVVNGTMPGPLIDVYEDQDVIVHVRNNLASESTSVHWHGLHQISTPWMDGVAHISHCPIGPGESFIYRFKANPTGSFIYHSHIGVQRTMGFYGPLIVRKRDEPVYDGEFFSIVSDWNHDWDSSVSYLKMINGIYTDRVQYQTTSSLDGAEFSRFRFDSGLINGKGRYYQKDKPITQTPLEVFEVTQGGKYLFRWANAGNMYPFRVSVDNHSLTIISSDGFDLKPVTAGSFIVNPGERFDFTITADQDVGNYWVRAVTLEVLPDGFEHSVQAILRYSGAPDSDPQSLPPICSAETRCLVLNCPFKYYPIDMYTDCQTFDQFKSLEKSDTSITDSSEKPVERFLNFAFPGDRTNRPGSVNGIAFKGPSASAQTQPMDSGDVTCSENCKEQSICECMHTLDLEHNKLYQLVFTNMGVGKGWSHPVHMHGHAFYVMKMGYSSFNGTSGEILDENMDVDCGGGVPRSESFCNNPKWSNTEWTCNGVPDMELTFLPRKDTIIVPTGGYTVVRIRADNPGVWYMHCHIELHNHNGMAMLLNESFGKHPKPPSGFPICGDYAGGANPRNPRRYMLVLSLIFLIWKM